MKTLALNCLNKNDELERNFFLQKTESFYRLFTLYFAHQIGKMNIKNCFQNAERKNNKIVFKEPFFNVIGTYRGSIWNPLHQHNEEFLNMSSKIRKLISEI